MTPSLPDALSPADLPLAELASARLDGELFRLADAWCPVDTVDGPTSRAGALRALAPPHAVVERLSAAWVYGLCPEPSAHQFCVDVRRRTRKPENPRLLLREVLLDPAETTRLAGLGLTTPLRTAADLARWGTAPGVLVDTELLMALLSYGGADGAAAAELVARRPRAAFTRVALAQLREAGRRLETSRR